MASDTQTQRERYWHLSLWLPKDLRQRINAVRGRQSINAWVREQIERALSPHPSP